MPILMAYTVCCYKFYFAFFSKENLLFYLRAAGRPARVFRLTRAGARIGFCLWLRHNHGKGLLRFSSRFATALFPILQRRA
ncbi:MAG: hypothetical protein DU429_01905 [Candidatus Tokpelaia sp.]|nr:MAG: hypothetical protein DU430_03620 [Candidatus Tokpelaia sp.]KAA6207263.1 MAG: hypothetical protein DU429_01905 [Candidatus Tokpelaia sp.]